MNNKSDLAFEATQIQALIRGHLSRKKHSLFHEQVSPAPIPEKEMPQYFRKAAASGDLKTCQALLKRKPSLINIPGSDSGKTALHWAAEKRHVDVVYFLLEHQASLLKDKRGYTAYDVTTIPEIRRALSYHFKDYFMHNDVIDQDTLSYNEAIKFGFTLSEESINDCYGSLQEKSLITFHEALRNHRLTVNSYIRGLPLMMAMITFEYFAPHKNIAFWDYFLEKKVNLNLKAHRRQSDAYEGTLLHSLLANENIKTVLYILKKAREEGLRVDPSIQDVEGKTIILIGALLQNTLFVSTCLEQFGNAAINIPDELGRTPLHYAYLFGDQPMIDLLTHHGANLECRDHQGNRPMDMLYVNKETIVSAFRKFHINAITRTVSDGTTLLDKCISDRRKVRNTVEQALLESSARCAPK
jgi:ankyrin repeat protein